MCGRDIEPTDDEKAVCSTCELHMIARAELLQPPPLTLAGFAVGATRAAWATWKLLRTTKRRK